MDGHHPFYIGTFVGIAGVTACLEFFRRSNGTKAFASNRGFLRFRDNYLFVYALMMAGDWLQGPYVYALYQHYGYQVGDIGRLFIAGFGSSMVFGTIAGSMADKHGRKLAALVYVVSYALSCVTKHWGSYHVLMVGRLLGGISTSLLFSAFESWLVSEHFKRGYDEDWLGDTFSKAVMLGNGFIAILSGLLANHLVESMKLGPVAPFDAAIFLLLVGGATIIVTWPENYGDNSHNSSLSSQFADALGCIMGDRRILLLGVMQAVFEGAMYTFVFLWTPALSPNGERIPHGFIFAMFMVSSMCGSALVGQLFSIGAKPERYMVYVFGVATLCMCVPITFHMTGVPDAVAKTDATITPGGMIQCLGFCVFEMCIGMFWPSMMRMRAHYLPDELRSTLINFFRVPLNLFVCVVLYNVSKFPLAVMFGLCAIFMFVAMICCQTFRNLTKHEEPVRSSLKEAAAV